MNFCVAIELSKKSISFLYYRSDSAEQRFKHFEGLDPVLPLAIYCRDNDMEIGKWAQNEALRGNPNAYTDVFSNKGSYMFRGKTCSMNTLVYNAILVKLEYFFNQILLGVENQLEQNVATMPVCIVLDSDLSENEALLVTNSFLNGGFGNVGIYNYNQIVVDVSSISTPYALCMKSDGVDLNVSLYDKRGKTLGTENIKGVGADPRVSLAAKLMWESAGYSTYYFAKDVEEPYLLRAAEDFVNSGDTEFNGNIELSKGNSLGCFISRHQLDNYNYADNHLLRDSVSNFLKSLHIPSAQCTLFLMGKAAGNVYFRDVFSASFADARDVGSSFRSEVFSELLNDVISDRFRLQPIGQTVGAPSDPWPGEPVNVQPMTGGFSAHGKGSDAVDHRKVRVLMADIKGCLSSNNVSKAETKLTELRQMLAEAHCNEYDDKIAELEKAIRQDKTKSSLTLQSVRKIAADIVGNLRANNLEMAQQRLASLEKEMLGNSNKFMIAAVNKVKELVDNASGSKKSSTEKHKDEQAAQDMNGNDRDDSILMIKRGDFAQAKRKFAECRNDKMVKVCVELISANGVIRMAQGRLSALQQKKDQKQIKRIVDDLSKARTLFRNNGVPTANIDSLLNSYKKI